MLVRKSETIAVKALHPHPANVRTHSKKQIAQIARSIGQFGVTAPIIVDENSTILAGHARVAAAKLQGFQEIPAIVLSGLSDVEKRAYVLLDNKLADNAGWDRGALALELKDLAPLLEGAGLDLDFTGFSPAEIDSLLGDLVDPEQDPADRLPEIGQTAVSQRGDLWQLDRHRLLCGDARDAADLNRLMGGTSAAMVISDPPYNVAVSSIQGRGRIKHREFVAAAGELSGPEFTQFLVDALSLAARHSVDGAIHFIFMGWTGLREILDAGAKVYGRPKNVIAWVKTNAGQGSFYRSQHELVFVFKHGRGPHQNNFELGQHGRTRSNVWNYAGVNTFRAGRMDDLSAHPTVKPVALVADAMRDCSRRGDIVLDPFMGSGTIFLAAERVGRRGYGLELDPIYVDVAVRRWQDFTRKDAILAGTSTTFDEVAKARTTTLSAGGSR